MVSFQSVRVCHAGSWGRRVINNVTELPNLGAKITIFKERGVLCYNSSMVVLGVANWFLIVFEAHSTRGNLCLLQSTWSRALGWGGQSSKEEPITTILLKKHVSKHFLNIDAYIY